MMNLRDYQDEAIQRVEKGWSEHKRQVLVLPTGSGKTIVFSFLVKRYPGRCLIIAHTQNLIFQAQDKLRSATGIRSSIEMAEDRADLDSRVVIASRQTLAGRIEKYDPEHFDFIIVDECHHILSDEYMKIMDYFRPKHVLGVTATFDRADRKNLGQFFENIAYEVTLFDLIRDGYLSRIMIRAIPIDINVNDLKIQAGDYSKEEIHRKLKPHLAAIADHVKKYAFFRKTLIFTPRVETSVILTHELNRIGMKAAHVDGAMKEKWEVLQAFSDNQYNVLSNSMLLMEGYDEPSIDCILNLRLTRHRSTYSQIVGRGTRVCEGKDDLLLLDPLFHHESHSLIHPAQLIARSAEEADCITKKSAQASEPTDIEDLLAQAEQEREDRLKEEMLKRRARKARTVDAMEYALNAHDIALAEYEPAMPWEFEPVSEKQIETLISNGIDPGTIKNKGHASKVLDSIFTRHRLNMATAKQVRFLVRHGHPSPHTAKFEEARGWIDAKIQVLGSYSNGRPKERQKGLQNQ